MTFRLNAQHVLLTYARCDETKEDLLQHLQDLHGENLKNYVVCQEKHQDGANHLHAALQFHRKINIRNPRHWDFKNFHPNARSDRRGYHGAAQYAKKDEDFLEGEAIEVNELKEFCINANWEEWLFECQRRRVAQFYCTQIWDLCHPDPTITLLEDTPNDGTMEPWLLNEVPQPTDYVTLLIGPSGSGKTTWAKKNAEKPCLFVSHIDQLAKFNPSFHKSIIFDDCKFTHWPGQAQIHLVDYHDARAIHIRYKTATIPPRIKKYFTCNEMPFSTTGDCAPAINRRISRWIVKDVRARMGTIENPITIE